MCRRQYTDKSVRLFNDVLEFTGHENTKAILFSADFEKAFNLMDHSFVQWVQTLVNNAESDPLSAYLFLLALEILFIQIRNNRKIHGIEIDDVTIKLSAYADDTYFFTLDSQSFQIILKVCENFSDYSTLKLNIEKSQACSIG